MINKKIKGSIMNFIRLSFRKADVFQEIKKLSEHPTAKGPRGGKMWQCNQCFKPLKGKEVLVDHDEPVVPIGMKQADMSLDEYAQRLYCDVSNLQVLCSDCHKEKSYEEAHKRKLSQNQDKN